MSQTSISALAALLAAATSFRDDGSGTTANMEGQQAHSHDGTKMTSRAAVRRGAARKARALSKHRPVLVRWAPATTCAGALKQPQRRRRRSRQQQQHTQTGINTSNIGSSSSRASGETLLPATTAADRNQEVRLDGDHAKTQLLLVTTESLGRHIVAGTGGIPAGKVVLKEAPYAWALHSEFDGDFCAECLLEIAACEVLCPGCGLVAYCSAACSSAALRGWHGGECLDDAGAALAVTMSEISPACRVALRAFRRARRETTPPPTKQGDSEAPLAADAAGKVVKVAETEGADPDAYDAVVPSPANGDGGDIDWPAVKLTHLQAHYTERSGRERELLETEAALAAVLAHSGGSDESALAGGEAGRQSCELLAAELVTTFFQVTTNGFAVSFLRSSEPSIGPHVQSVTHVKVAVGLYMAAAMLNHSCRPNALVTFDGREMRVVVTRAIPEGEPVTISYGPLASKVSSTSERRAYLQKAYFFRCDCSACRPPPVTAASSPGRPGGREDCGEQQQQLASHDRLRAAAAARSKRTDFACTNAEVDSCPGTLLVGAPPPFPAVSTPSASAANIAKGKVGLWCDHCGNRIPPGSANELLREDEEDRRLWEEAVEAVSLSEMVGETKDFGRGGERGRPPSGLPPPRGSTPEDTSQKSAPSADSSDLGGTEVGNASALRLVVERVKWRDARLSPLSMRRAAAHDMHARILAGRMDFAGAADACGRALSVLVKRFAPEDQELGVEFLKLAELCFNAGWMDKCHRACRKARLSLGVFAEGDEKLVSLDNLQALSAASHR
ncbi:unnamed protein product [Scytosiphon promiscuus]